VEGYNKLIEKRMSDPEQKLMIAVWMMALHDINQGFLLQNNVFQFDELSDRGAEILENFWDAYYWMWAGDGTFPLVAALFNIETDELRAKSLKVILQSADKIQHRSKLTNQYIYATVSRFRDYDKAFQDKQ
jgi:hypothetical protein